ncbi:RagB/SusD family nutrient uptake outer membrane protein [Marinifilum sp. D714]|uniref:RagB/SusD family nutrient uptake outer membrane protein n=1 Tax=Marinifilum sp. D714 TaxID=2937523 RepID=UPI0027C74944|nr:RagB/SusD family nutrient uptake outer membrane protein [Marinifilum sp. D714]MDQ2178608.1 RagB/SusD family nutrient uptake outer membrane protein [Marinifilum sp. D714]
MMKFKYIILGIFILTFIGCSDDFLEAEPEAQVTPEQLADLPASKLAGVIEGKLKGVYSTLLINEAVSNREPYSGQKSYDLVSDLFSGDMVMTAQGYGWYWWEYTLQVHSPTYSRPTYYWRTFYSLIYSLNGIIETMPTVPEDPKLASIYAQARGLRGYCYFKLINMLQHPYLDDMNAPGVPVYTTSVNDAPKGRNSVGEVYTQIVNDLDSAQIAFNVKDVASLGVRDFNENALSAIYAQVALFMGDYEKAEVEAKKAKVGYSFMTESKYQSGFNDINNDEWIWGIDVTTETNNSYDSFFSHVSSVDDGYTPFNMYKIMDAELFSHIDENDYRYNTFYNQDADNRAAYGDAWQNKFYNEAGKELDWVSDYVLMRVSEMYLIEAEALARQGKDGEAKTVLLDLINARCNNTDPYNVASLSGDALLQEIYMQARIELWGEGRALYYKKRFKKTIIRDYTGSNHGYLLPDMPYNHKDILLMIPDSEINNNPEITPDDQNP